MATTKKSITDAAEKTVEKLKVENDKIAAAVKNKVEEITAEKAPAKDSTEAPAEKETTTSTSAKTTKSAAKSTKSTAKSAATKAAAKTTAAKTATKAAAAVKDTVSEAVEAVEKVAKKAAVKKSVDVFVQYGQTEVKTDDLVERAKSDFAAAGNKKADAKNVRLYVKPEEMMVYYVINDDYQGEFRI